MTIAVHRDLQWHPVVGMGLPVRGPNAFSHHEAWLWILFSASAEPQERSLRDLVISIDRGELLISNHWLASRCHWGSAYARRFLRAVDDGDLAVARPLLPEWPVHGDLPFILGIVRFESFGDARGNIDLPVSLPWKIKKPRLISQYERHHILMSTRREVYARDNYRCAKCGSETNLSIDHIIAVSSGGDNSVDNLRTLCMPCNTSKGAKNGDRI